MSGVKCLVLYMEVAVDVYMYFYERQYDIASAELVLLVEVANENLRIERVF